MRNVKVVLHNEPHAEDNAMLQALYSRSAESVTEHIEKLKTVGSGKFMSQYYLGYGHASIADCGFITVYVEGVSMLAAKAIQDNPLYNGQESSSRYIDWSYQPFINPYYGSDSAIVEKGEKLLTSYRNFYATQKPVIVEHLTNLYPKKEDEKQIVYEKAVLAKAFDILRGFLPCGSATNVSWTTSLRKANEHLHYLSLHPLNEIREIAVQLHAGLSEAYPNSIAALPVYEETDLYTKELCNYYSTGFNLTSAKFEVETQNMPYIVIVHSTLTKDTLSLPEVYNNRPRKGSLPKHDFSLQSTTNYFTKLDFGSYRDLQRHRGGYCSLPAIDNDDGFHKWYYEQLPASSKLAAVELFEEIKTFIAATLDSFLGDDIDNSTESYHLQLTLIKLQNQYLLPMGTLVNVGLVYDVHQSLYVAELRSGQTVHATLRPVAQDIGKFLEEGLGIKTYCDYSEDAWNTRRGSQDIIEKAV